MRRHRVKSYTRRGRPVRSHMRGRVKPKPTGYQPFIGGPIISDQAKAAHYLLHDADGISKPNAIADSIFDDHFDEIRTYVGQGWTTLQIMDRLDIDFETRAHIDNFYGDTWASDFADITGLSERNFETAMEEDFVQQVESIVWEMVDKEVRFPPDKED